MRRDEVVATLENTKFQSTHSHGVRHNRVFSTDVRRAVSIHALTWSATVNLNHSRRVERFQSTHSHGVRPLFNLHLTSFHVFQSTHSHGVRPNILTISKRHASFNPRTHMECDKKVSPYSPEIKFQSTHSHGVRLINLNHSRRVERFQSTHSHGVRLLNQFVPRP